MMRKPLNLDQVQRVGIAAAYKGAEVLESFFGRISRIDKKGAIDLVTEADTGAEKRIIQTIRNTFPDHSILAEESGLTGKRSDCRWIVDPLDGTTNFAHRLDVFANSIAFAIDGEIALGIVLIPAAGELFAATRGRGATLNGRPIRVSSISEVGESLLVTGFPYNFKELLEPIMARFTRCLSAAQGVRRLGSAAIDLCYLACGRFEAFWEEHLAPWDTAAGFLIAKEAGATVTDFGDQPFTVDKQEILATNGLIHKEMLDILAG
jgi:myo-inositol-1(or 4)-monophosphatase